MKPRTTNVFVVCLFLMISVSGKTMARAAEGTSQDKASAISDERRRLVNLDNRSVELFYGRTRKNPGEEQRGNAASRTAGLTEPNRALHSEITPRTSSRRAAALRLAESGRRLLQSGEYERALLTFEKALALDPVPYVYYYLARAHHHLNNYQESVTFLDVAESRLSESHDWIVEVAALKRANARALTKRAQETQAVQETARNKDKQTATVATHSLSAVLALVAVLCFLAFATVWSARFRRSLS